MSSGKKEPSKRQLSDEEDEPVLKRPHISATADNPVNLELQSATCDAANSSTSWIDDLHATSEDEESMPLQNFDIDDKLEEKLKKHGLNRRNAKTIIHELLNDQNVLELLKANLEKKEPVSLPEAKTLRSKQKKSTPDKLKFTELPLPDDDDDDDDEYRPDFNFDLDNTFDTETSQDTQATFDPPIGGDKSGSNDSFMSKLKQCDNEIQAIQANSEKEIIALRTRSKHSLLDIAMAEIETAFQPPDVTDDMYKPSGDDDWHKWLAELMFDDQISTKPEVVEDDCEQDPDYDFLQSDTEEVHDMDDFKGGHATHIPKKEVQELLQERHIPTVSFQGELQASNTSKIKLTKMKIVPRNVPLENSSFTAKEHLAMRRIKLVQLEDDTSPQRNTLTTSQVGPVVASSGDNLQNTKVKKSSPSNDLQFTALQLEAMKTQLRQHVQLLTQVNLLSRNSSNLSTIAHESHALLKELQQMDEHDRLSFNLKSSYFNVPCLDQALNIVQLNIKKSDEITKIPKSSRSRGLLPIQRNVGVIIATNPVFAYAPLLPHVAPPANPSENSRIIFTPSEDCLLVLGVAQMQGHALPWHTLVYQYMMPCKQPEQLRTRYSNAIVRNEAENPIRIYKRTRKLPTPPDLFSSSVGFDTDAKCLLDLKNTVLPDWLHVLQQELEHFSTYKAEKLPVQVNDVSAIPSLQQAVVPESLPQPQQPEPQTSSVAISLPTVSLPTVMANQSTTTIAIVSPIKSISILMPGFVSTQVQPVIHPRIAPKSEAKKLTPITSKKSKPLVRSVKFSKKRKKDKVENEKETIESTANEVKTSAPEVEANQLHGVVAKKSAETGVCGVTIIEDVDIPNLDSPNISPVKSPHLAEAMEVEIPHDSVSTNETAPSISTSLQKPSTPPKEEKSVTKNNPLTGKEESNPEDEELEDEAVTTEDDFDEEADLNEGADEMSEEEVMASKKRVGKKKKELKVKWKSQNKTNTKQLGGRLHRLHPGLSGKRKSKASEDDLSKSLRESAGKVKLLEEETIVQLDPLRGEKEILFAQGYLKRVEESLADKPEVFIKVLETLVEFDGDLSQPPTALFNKLSKLLQPWPDLLQGFAPFLLPEQAHKCGLLSEQQVYARARKFLRQLEIRFQESPQQLTRILNTFKAIAETGIYKEKEVKNTILSLLKCDPYLQEEFLMFFDDERPPESRLHGDYEEVMWSDDLLKETHNPSFEHVFVPATGHQHEHSITNEVSTDTIRSPGRQQSSKSSKEVTATVDAAEVKKDDVKERRSTSTTWDELPPTDTEEETGESSSHKDVIPSLPDIALISEDALSCSPFKRHQPNSSSCTRPLTPTADVVAPDDVSLPPRPPSSPPTTSLGLLLPATPSASKSSIDADVAKPWTFDDDKVLLNSCKEHGSTDEAFDKVSNDLGRSNDDVRIRFQYLMTLLSGHGESVDTDTTSHYTTDSESEVSAGE